MTDNYVPKHRGEPVVKWRLHYMESERGWGQDYFHVDFDTEEAALKAKAKCNARNTSPTAPAYYIVAQNIEKVTL